jgi:alkylation response protein AidB-like acyl-CoA dehydrogenase
MTTTDRDGELLSLLEQSTRSFLAKRHDRRRLQETDGDPAALWPEMAELGLLGLSLPEDDGGGGLGPFAIARVAGLLGEQIVPEPYVASSVIIAALISALHLGERRSEFAALLSSGSERLTLAWQETPGQIAAWPAQCVIDETGNLHGRKIFVPGAGARGFATAMYKDQPALALIDFANDTVTRETHPSADGLPYTTMTFAQTPVGDDAILLTGSEAEAAVEGALALGTLALSAQLTGLVRGLLDLTVDYLKTRVQFDRPIGSFQVLQHRAVDLRIALALAEASVKEAARLLENAPASRQAAAAVSAAKARAAAAAMLACNAAFQMHGAIGFTAEADVGLYARAALKWTGWLGGARDHRRRFIALGGDRGDD